MSGITGVSGSTSSQLLEQLGMLARQRAEKTSTGSMQTGQTGESRQAQFESVLDDALSQAGLDDAQIDEVKNEIQAAVSSALSGSDSSADPRNAVGQAIEGVLKEHGVDTDAMKTETSVKVNVH